MMFKIAACNAAFPLRRQRHRYGWKAIVRMIPMFVLAACQHPHAPTPTATSTAAKPAVPTANQGPVSPRRPPARTITPVPASSGQVIGRIRVIGAHGSFVLIETPSALVTRAVPAGCLLHSRPPGTRGGPSTADLRVTPERRPPFLVADVVSGTPTVGDEAYYISEANPTPAPAAVVPLLGVPDATPTLFPATTP